MSRRIEAQVTRPQAVTIEVDGRPIAAVPGEMLVTAMIAAGIDVFRIDTQGHARGLFCNMGTCGECFVTIIRPGDVGRRRRACLVPVIEGLRVEAASA